MLMFEPQRDAPAIARARSGRWLAGVCAGIAGFRDVPVALVRAIFILGALLAGLGVALYLACWLILPAVAPRPGATGVGADAVGEAGDGAATDHPAGLVTLSRALGGVLAVGALVFASATVTVFGFGWIVVAAAALTLVLMVLIPTRVSLPLGMLAIAAIVVPSVAASLAPVGLSPQLAAGVVAPAQARSLAKATITSGLGTMFIDLRRTTFPATGQIPIHIRAGIRRTIIALPDDRCVHVRVHLQVHSLDANLATLLSGHGSAPATGLVLFNREWSARTGELSLPPTGGTRQGPTLDIDFRSRGGSLQVRDYPDSIDPRVNPDWPGLAESIDPRPQPEPGLSASGYRADLHYWQRSVRQERAYMAQLDQLLPGPCRA